VLFEIEGAKAVGLALHFAAMSGFDERRA